jgi:hypothetical protein
MLTLGAFAAFAAPATASAESTHPDRDSKTERSYLRAYEAAKNATGEEQGRNIVLDGVARKGPDRDAKTSEIRSSTRKLKAIVRIANAPEPVQATASSSSEDTTTGQAESTGSTTSQSSSSSSSSSGAGAGLESIAACESGGNPSAVSPDGQYRGKYQFDRQTWQSVGGSGDPAAASESEQDSRAAALVQQRGTSPWGCAG